MGFQGVRYRGSHQDVLEDEDLLLFTEVTPIPAELVEAP